jgi:kynurenine formamidase
MTAADITKVRELCTRYSNWGRWGPDDERGTLNHVGADEIVRAAALVRSGKVISMALPYDENGPQTGHLRRFNPIHVMFRDGSDVIAGTSIRDFYGGEDKHFRGTDDLIIMPLQSGTQWDALSHVVFENRIYNGYGADQVSSWGARRNDVCTGASGMVGRGILLDLPRATGRDWLQDGEVVGEEDLEAAAGRQGLQARRGDFVLVRTGAMTRARQQGSWGDYAGGPAPGLGLSAVDWIARHEIAAVATDTWGMEVRPNETADVLQPLHIILIAHMGLWVGEIFDLDALADECAGDGRYEFLFCGPPLPFTGAVGSPLNPIAIK